MKIIPTFLLSLFAMVTMVSAQQRMSYHTTLFGTIDPSTAPGSRWKYSALTGYAAPNGREYALLGGHDGTFIIDVTESPLRQVAFIPGPPSDWREMKTFRDFAYVVTEGGGGLQIIDLSELPKRARLLRTDTAFYSAHTITQEGTFLYVNGTDPGAGAGGGTMIFEVGTNPLYPRLAGIWSERYVHDCTVRHDTMYASAIENGMLDIVYLGKNRANPVGVGSFTYPGAGTHNSDVVSNGGYLMTTDEVGSTPKTLKIWDIRDVDAVEKVADYTPAPGEIVHNVHTKGRLAYVSWYTAGTRIIDVTDPRNPVQVGYYDTYPGAKSAYEGNWGTYPYLPSGKIISSDMARGLFVFTFDNSLPGSITGVVRNKTTGNPIAGAVVSVPALGFSVTTGPDGRYRVAGAAGDTFAVKAGATGYLGFEGSSVTSSSGSPLDIELEQIVFSQMQITAIDAVTGQPIPSFAYRLFGPVEAGVNPEGTAANNPQMFSLPRNAYSTVYIGAWGYLPEAVELYNTGAPKEVVLKRGYFDDADLDLGWTMSAPTDDATMGMWERGVPVGTSANGIWIQPDTDASTTFSDHAFITRLSTNNELGPGLSDIDSGRVSLISPAIDLTEANDPWIEFNYWYSRDGYPGPGSINDTLRFYLSNDDGATWTDLARITESPRHWKQFRFKVDSLLPLTSRMRLKVEASDLDVQSWVEAGLDDFRVIVTEDPVSGIADESMTGVATSVLLHPNPMTASATVEIRSAVRRNSARLELYDMLGRHVKLMMDGPVGAGLTRVPFDASSIAPGQYVWRLVLDDGSVQGGVVSVVR